jgi:ribosome-binding factor A
MPSQRQLRVGEAIRHALANVLMRGDVPWPKGFAAPVVTITEVTVSPDLQNAIAFVIPLGGKKTDSTVTALNAIVGFFRHALAESVKLRYVPRLTFKADDSFTNAQNIEKILQDPVVAKDLAKD